MRSRTINTITNEPGTYTDLYLTNRWGSNVWHAPTGVLLYPNQRRKVSGFTGSSYDGRVGTSSTIQDILDSTRTGYNDCYHTKETWDAASTSYSHVGRFEYQGYIPIDYEIVGKWAPHGEALSVGALMPPEGEMTVTKMRSIARSSIKLGAIPEEIDLTRAIAELRDFSGAFKGFLKRTHRLWETNHPIRDLRVMMKRDGDQILASFRRTPGLTAVNADLTWKFAIQPIIGDVNKLLRAVARIDELIQRLALPGVYIARGRYQAPTQSVTALMNNDNGRRYANASGLRIRECSAWALVQRDALPMGRFEAFRALTKLTLNMSTIWDLYPLSFVVDWFIRFGRFFHQFDGSPIVVPYRVVKTGSSYKVTNVYTAVGYPFGGLADIGPLPGLASPATVTSTYYARTADSTPVIQTEFVPKPLTFGMPNVGQITTLCELLYGMMRR